MNIFKYCFTLLIILSLTGNMVAADSDFDSNYGGTVIDMSSAGNGCDSSCDSSVPVYGTTNVIRDDAYSGNYLDMGYANNYDYPIGFGFGVSAGVSYGSTLYNSGSYGTVYNEPINWLGYGRSGGSTGSTISNTNVTDSYNYYDNSMANTYTDNSFCIGNNNCNTTHTNIVTNTTTVNGNNNSVNSSANGSTGSSINCPTGYTASNGNCLQVPSNDNSSWYIGSAANMNPSQTIVNCNSGYYYNGSSCVQNVNYNPTPIYQAPTPVYQAPIYNTPIYNTPIYNTPVYTTPIYNYNNYKTCQNGTTVYVGQNCYKTCPNGNTVIETQSCQKLCPNNVYVYEYQNCPVINVVNYNYPVVDISADKVSVVAGDSVRLNWAASNANYCNASGDWTGSPTLIGERVVSNMTRSMSFTITCYNANGQSAADTVYVTVSGYAGPYNKAVTTIPTNVTNSSAVCNGVAISNNNIANTGYFEVSELDRYGNIVKTINTNSASIGSANSNYYSAPVNGLKSNTKYSCRAVVNNNRGVMKGEAIGFTTSGAKVNYVSTVIPKKNNSSKNVSSNIVCTDSNGNKVTLDANKKMLDVSINKVSQNIRAGEPTMYTISIKNNGGLDISNVSVKLALDKSLTLINNEWSRDIDKNYNIDNIGTLYKGSEKVYIVKYMADKKDIGTSVVSTVYVSYEMNTNKGVYKDEVSVYTIDSIIESINMDNDNKVSTSTTENNKSDNKSIIAWIDELSFGEVLAIFGMLIIAALLARNIYLLTINRQNKANH